VTAATTFPSVGHIALVNVIDTGGTDGYDGREKRRTAVGVVAWTTRCGKDATPSALVVLTLPVNHPPPPDMYATTRSGDVLTAAFNVSSTLT
jgi:hypothetical protein